MMKVSAVYQRHKSRNKSAAVLLAQNSFSFWCLKIEMLAIGILLLYIFTSQPTQAWD